MHFLNRMCQHKKPTFNCYISARVALRHVDLERNPDTLLYTCVAAICELHDHKMLTDVGRPMADSCAVLLHELKTMTTFIYHLSYTMFFNVFPLHRCCSIICGNCCRCHADTVTTCKTWLLTDGWLPQRGGCFYLMFLQAAKQWPSAQEWFSPFRGWQNNSLPVAIHEPVAEKFSFYIMSWLTVPCIAWPSNLSDMTEYWCASCKWLSTWINLNFQKLAVTSFI